MKHYFTRRKLSAYLDSELPEAARRRLEAHLQACSSCRGALDEIRSGRALAEISEPPRWENREALWQKVQRSEKDPAAPVRAHSVIASLRKALPTLPAISTPALVAVSAAVVLALTLVLQRQEKEAGNPESPVQSASAFALDFGPYLDALTSNRPPREFEQRYASRRSSYEAASRSTPFRMASLSQISKNLRLGEVKVLTSVCCNLVEFNCSRNAEKLVLFQQPKEHPVSFAPYRAVPATLNGLNCKIVKAGKWTAITWEGEDSQFVAFSQLSEGEIVEALAGIM